MMKERRLKALEIIGPDYLEWLKDNWESFQKETSIVKKIDYSEGDIRRILKPIDLHDGDKDTFVSIVIDLRVSTIVKAYPSFEDKEDKNNDKG